MNEKYMEAMQVIDYLPPNLVQFFDMDSEELLDEKIAVRDALKAGTPIDEIPDFYTILENYPHDGEKDGIATVTLWM